VPKVDPTIDRDELSGDVPSWACAIAVRKDNDTKANSRQIILQPPVAALTKERGLVTQPAVNGNAHAVSLHPSDRLASRSPQFSRLCRKTMSE
jgi:hypothetical protein